MSAAVRRSSRRASSTRSGPALSVLGAAVVGAAAMYLLDPDGGGRRRALVRDQLVHAAHRAEDVAGTTSRDLGNRARGVVAELRGRFVPADVSDDVLSERVRTRIGAVVGHAGAIQAEVRDGHVTLSGPALAEDVERLVRRVRAVRGVEHVENQLDVHEEPGNVPGLQGRPRPPRGGEVFELWQERWSPTFELAVTLGAVAVAVLSLRRMARGA
jgi:BON domain-containing protein